MNKFIGQGRLTKDPEVKTLQSGTEVCNFSIAVDRKFKREGQPTADFFNCIAFSKTAEFVGKWFTKGKMILLEGSLQNRSWDDQEGKKHYVTEVIVESVEFCGDKSSDNTQNQSNNQSNNSQNQGFQPIEESISDDDLPF